MLSYRHAFHAGNFADVLKHLILIRILEHLKKKDKPFCYIDTHAGPGVYNLQGEYALQNREFDNGIGTLCQRADLPVYAADYVKLVKQFNHKGSITRYPGSPSIAMQIMRPKDRLSLFELHTTEIKQLSALCRKDRRVQVHHDNGLSGYLGLLPPSEHRGLVLIDPSYEIKSEYGQVTDALLKMYKRFASGTYALWYPVIGRNRNVRLEHAIQASGIKNVQLFELGIEADRSEHGMTASGMIVINPPWTLADEMRQTLPWLADILGKDGAGTYRVQSLVNE